MKNCTEPLAGFYLLSLMLQLLRLLRCPNADAKQHQLQQQPFSVCVCFLCVRSFCLASEHVHVRAHRSADEVLHVYYVSRRCGCSIYMYVFIICYVHHMW